MERKASLISDEQSGSLTPESGGEGATSEHYEETPPKPLEAGESGRTGSSTVTSSSDTPIKSDIYLHFEVLVSTQHRIGQAVFFVLMCAGLALLATVIYFRVNGARHAAKWAHNRKIFKLQTAFGVICSCLLWPMLAWFIRRIWATRDCVWTRRQRYLVSVAFLQLVVQALNNLFWLVPNVYILNAPCVGPRVFSGLVDASAYIRWTCWNTVFCLITIHAHNCTPAVKKETKSRRKKRDPAPDRNNPMYGNNDRDPMILDGKFFRMHWIKLLYWIAFEASIIYFIASGGPNMRASRFEAAPMLTFWASCLRPKLCEIEREQKIDYCAADSSKYGKCAVLVAKHVPSINYLAVKAVWGALLLFYQCWTQMRLRWALYRLKVQPYNCYQLANMLLLWQKRQTLWMELIGIAEVANIYFNYETTVSYFQQWTGQPTLQVLITSGVVLNAFYFLPMEPSNEEHVYRAWLQQFAWTAEQIPRRQRALLKRSPTMGPRLHDKPMFCIETALKLLLWSGVVYEGDAGCGGEGDIGLSESVKTVLAAQQAGSGAGGVPGGLRAVVPTDASIDQITIDVGEEEASGEVPAAGATSRRSSSESQSSIDSSDTAKLASHHDLSSTRDGGVGGQATAEVKAKRAAIASKVGVELSGHEQLDLAMQMYGLEQHKIIHNEQTETKALVGWNGEMMVLSFRGTCNKVNMKSDVKAWRAVHPPQRGTFWLGTQPLVHKGFLRAWESIAPDVLAHVATVLGAASKPACAFKVLLTGHSLGGALATLAAFEIQTVHHLPNLACYTFGAPRTGNTAFAKEFMQRCPDCWHLINDRDAVPRTGKMLWMYKRPGERVLLSTIGDIRVRPNLFEINLLTQGWSVKQHYLTAYLKSLSSVCVAQLFKYKAIEGGHAGVRKLAKSLEICKLLASAGVDLPAALKQPPLELTSVKRRCWWATPLVDLVRELPPFVINDD